jgi:hypothetical protein
MSIRENNLLRYIGGVIVIIIGIALEVIILPSILSAVASGSFNFPIVSIFFIFPLLLILQGAILAGRPYRHFTIGLLLISESIILAVLIFLGSGVFLQSSYILMCALIFIGSLLGVLYKPPKRTNMPSFRRSIILPICLILLFSVILIVIFDLSSWSSGAPIGTTCIATPGFTCQVVRYVAAGAGASLPPGNLIMVIGQDSGTAWSTVNVYFVNASYEYPVQSSGLNGVSGLAAPNTISGGLASGVNTTVVLPASSTDTKTGSSINGYIWVSYTTNGSDGHPVQEQIASLVAKAT